MKEIKQFTDTVLKQADFAYSYVFLDFSLPLP